MLRWLAIGLVAYVVFKLLTNTLRKHTQDQKSSERQAPEEAHTKTTGNMVKDPVCGSYVDADTSISVRDGATVYHFCDYECRDAFLNQLRVSGRSISQHTAQNGDQDDSTLK